MRPLVWAMKYPVMLAPFVVIAANGVTVGRSCVRKYVEKPSKTPMAMKAATPSHTNFERVFV
jgi:hypothetical protein